MVFAFYFCVELAFDQGFFLFYEVFVQKKLNMEESKDEHLFEVEFTNKQTKLIFIYL